jgi:hypothetical protein
MKKLLSTSLLLAGIITGLPTYAHDWDGGRPDGHAPIGVMGDHMHAVGEWMLSYRYMNMKMDGMRDGTDDLSSQKIFDQGYMVAPTDMESHMHMVGGMYAPSDTLTIMLMASYGEKEMNHLTRPGSMARTRMGERFPMNTEGWGDLSVSAMYLLYREGPLRVHANLGVSAPSGELTERAYPMHYTTGTWDLLPGITWSYQGEAYSAGTQINGRVHLGENSREFTYGDKVGVTPWVAYKLSEWASVSGRLKLDYTDSVDGLDEDHPAPFAAPPLDPANHGGVWLDYGLGLNLYASEGTFKGHRLALEVLLPAYQDLNGPQLKRESTLLLGWQKAF